MTTKFLPFERLKSTLKCTLKRVWCGVKLYKRWLGIALPMVVIAAIVFVPEFAFAAEPDSQTTTDVVREMTALLTKMSAFLSFILYPLLLIIGALMDNEMLLGPAMEEKLLMIWIEIRNWVNIFFVLILVGIAFYNVLGIAGDGSNYALKSILPKIVIALIAVNFSFLAGKLMIDSVQVVTNAVYALPNSGNLANWDEARENMRVQLCKNKLSETDIRIRLKKDSTILGAMFCEVDAGGTELTGQFNSFGQKFFGHFGQHNVAVALMVQLGNMANIETPDEGGLDAASQITLAVLFNIFMFVMFGFAFVALIVVLIARIIILWLCLALSPLAVLVFLFPDLASQLGSGELNLKDQFFKHLFVPLVIGVVFSVGFVMLNTMKETSAGGWLGVIGELNLKDLEENSDALESLASTYGSDLSNFETLLIAIGTVVLIWVGVFGAASNTVASGIVGSIKGAGESFGKFVAKLPAYATIIPVKTGGDTEEKVPLMSVLGIPRLFGEELSRTETQGFSALRKRLGFGQGTREKVDEGIQYMRTHSSDKKEQLSRLDYQLKSTEGLYNEETQLKRLIAEMSAIPLERKKEAAEAQGIEALRTVLRSSPWQEEFREAGVTPDESAWRTAQSDTPPASSAASGQPAQKADQTQPQGEAAKPPTQNLTQVLEQSTDGSLKDDDRVLARQAISETLGSASLTDDQRIEQVFGTVDQATKEQLASSMQKYSSDDRSSADRNRVLENGSLRNKKMDAQSFITAVDEHLVPESSDSDATRSVDEDSDGD